MRVDRSDGDERCGSVEWDGCGIHGTSDYTASPDLNRTSDILTPLI